MRVTDEMVEAGLSAARAASDARLPRYSVVRAILEAALSHAAGQEAEQRPTQAPETGEWYWLEDGDLFHSQVSMNGQHLGRYYRDDGRGWEDVRKAEKLAPTLAPPTTSAEVGLDADNVPKILMRAVNSANAAGAKDLADDIFSLMDKHWPIVVWSATSGRQAD